MKTMSRPEEFLSLFGAEPTLLDPGVPWAYNTVRFETKVAVDAVAFTMCPGYGECTVEWRRGGELLLDLLVDGVESVTVRDGPTDNCLDIAFQATERGLLTVRFKPRVSVVWRAPSDVR
jgi:hypothetical protein